MKYTNCKPAGIRDVPKRAGVSVASVSRTLNNKHSEVSEALRKRVLDACWELACRPNPGIQDLVRRGRNGHTGSLAFVVVGQKGICCGHPCQVHRHALIPDHAV
jgi:DNA-binding LacI/PurR family transcriptional regulator